MKVSFDKTWALMVLMSLSPLALSQENQGMVLENNPLNIEGYVQDEQQVITDNELESIHQELKKQQREIKLNREKSKGFQKLQRSTEKLAEVTEDYIEEKKYAQESIDRYNKKIDCLLKDSMAEGCDEFLKGRRGVEQDQVAVEQAAPQRPEQSSVSEVEEQNLTSDKSLRLIPFLGAKSFNSSSLSLETQYSGGVRVESRFNERLNIGAGFSLLKMDSQLITSTVQSGVYQAVYSQGRELSYNNLSLDFYGRYALAQASRLTPYVGAGMSYNRSKLGYKDNNPAATVGNTVYSNESYVNHYVAANLALGTDIAITKDVGLNLQLDYIQGIGSSLTSDSAVNPTLNADQQKLIDVSNQIIDANIFSVSLGLLVHF